MGGNVHGLYHCLGIIGPPTTLGTSGQQYHNFGPSYSTNNDVATIKIVIVNLLMIQKRICECCGRIVYKADACITRVPKYPHQVL